VSASLDQTVRVWDISGLRKKSVAPSGDEMLRLPQVRRCCLMLGLTASCAIWWIRVQCFAASAACAICLGSLFTGLHRCGSYARSKACS
jgi:hypothetical protein